MKNYFQVLGLEEGATLDEIKAAYRTYAKNYHPDKQNGNEFFKVRFQEIQEAYEYLSKNYNIDVEISNSQSSPSVNTATNTIPNPQIVIFQVKGIIEVGATIDIYWETQDTTSVQLEIENNGVSKRINTHSGHGLISPSYSYTIEELTEEIILHLHGINKEKTIEEKLILQRATLREEIIKPNINTYKKVIFNGFLTALSYYLVICIFYILIAVIVFVALLKIEFKMPWILLCLITCILGGIINAITFHNWYQHYIVYSKNKNNTRALEYYDIMLKMVNYRKIGWAGIILSTLFLIYTLIN